MNCPMKKILCLLLCALPLVAMGQSVSESLPYKTVDGIALNMEIITPPDRGNDQLRPAILFFFGGGWNGGTIEQFRPHAEYFTGRGMVSILADYRVKSRHQSSPFDALKDAKSAMRFVRQNADRWSINPSQIVASGGSAGGHLAAATACIEQYNDPADPMGVSCIPDALVLFNPVIDNGSGGYGYERVGDQYLDFSPLHNIRPDLPPTIFFLGTQDALIPVETGQYYQTAMQKSGNRCDLHLYEGAGHGFFNLRNQVWYSETVKESDCFLQSLGFIDRKTIRPVVDTIGFAQHDWQMDSIVSRLTKRIKVNDSPQWKAAIAPHDDYKYAGEITMQALAGVRAPTVILFGVAHKASTFGLEDRLIFGSHSHWQAPFGYMKVSPIREDIMDIMDQNNWMIHDEMQETEHSLEAITPFLQHKNRRIEIIPILVPYMDYKKMNRIAKDLAEALTDIVESKGWEFGKDLAIVISNDAVHYGDQDWGGKNLAPFGSDLAGNQEALKLEHEIITSCLMGKMDHKKMKRFTEYTVQKADHRAYKWTWCGRYALPLGMLVANRLQENLYQTSLFGEVLGYATSIDHSLFTVEDLGMGTTAPANSHHWVGYVGVGYR